MAVTSGSTVASPSMAAGPATTDATARYLTGLLYKTPDEIRSEIAKLTANDLDLESEREQIALTNHRHLVYSIMKLDVVKSKTHVVQSTLDAFMNETEEIKTSMKEAQESAKGYANISKVCDEVVYQQELIEEFASTPMRLQALLEVKDLAKFVELYASFANSILDSELESVPHTLLEVVQAAVFWQRNAIKFLITEIGNVSTKITRVAEYLGLLKRLLHCRLDDIPGLSNEGSAPGRPAGSSSDDNLLSKAALTPEMPQAELFGRCRKLELERILSTFKWNLHSIPTPDLCDTLFDFMIKSEGQFAHSFKTQDCLTISQLLQQGFLFLWNILNTRLLATKDPLAQDDEQKSVFEEDSSEMRKLLEMDNAVGLWDKFDPADFMHLDFPSQMAALLKMPPILRQEQIAQFSAEQLSMSHLSQLMSKIVQQNAALAKIGADMSIMLLAPIKTATKYRISSLLQNAYLELTQDITSYLSPNGERLFEDLSPGEPVNNQTEHESRLQRICQCPPLALWLNAHFSLFNECRFFPHQVQDFLVGGIFRSVQALLLTFRDVKSAAVISATETHKPILVRRLGLMSAVISSDLIPTLWDAEAQALALDANAQLNDRVHFRNTLLRTLMYRVL